MWVLVLRLHQFKTITISLKFWRFVLEITVNVYKAISVYSHVVKENSNLYKAVYAIWGKNHGALYCSFQVKDKTLSLKWKSGIVRLDTPFLLGKYLKDLLGGKVALQDNPGVRLVVDSNPRQSYRFSITQEEEAIKTTNDLIQTFIKANKMFEDFNFTVYMHSYFGVPVTINFSSKFYHSSAPGFALRFMRAFYAALNRDVGGETKVVIFTSSGREFNRDELKNGAEYFVASYKNGKLFDLHCDHTVRSTLQSYANLLRGVGLPSVPTRKIIKVNNFEITEDMSLLLKVFPPKEPVRCREINGKEFIVDSLDGALNFLRKE